jgi:hypothetical protein
MREIYYLLIDMLRQNYYNVFSRLVSLQLKREKDFTMIAVYQKILFILMGTSLALGGCSSKKASTPSSSTDAGLLAGGADVKSRSTNKNDKRAAGKASLGQNDERFELEGKPSKLDKYEGEEGTAQPHDTRQPVVPGKIMSLFYQGASEIPVTQIQVQGGALAEIGVVAPLDLVEIRRVKQPQPRGMWAWVKKQVFDSSEIIGDQITYVAISNLNNDESVVAQKATQHCKEKNLLGAVSFQTVRLEEPIKVKQNEIQGSEEEIMLTDAADPSKGPTVFTEIVCAGKQDEYREELDEQAIDSLEDPDPFFDRFLSIMGP